MRPLLIAGLIALATIYATMQGVRWIGYNASPYSPEDRAALAQLIENSALESRTAAKGR